MVLAKMSQERMLTNATPKLAANGTRPKRSAMMPTVIASATRTSGADQAESCRGAMATVLSEEKEKSNVGIL